jgi:hypothetical protein
MKMKLTAVFSVVAVTLIGLILANTTFAQGGESMRKSTSTSTSSSTQPQGAAAQGAGGAIVATQVTPQEAAKKYPPPKNGYPKGERDPHKASGVISSPYPPHTEFDCSQIPKGGLVLDSHVNKVFVRP